MPTKLLILEWPQHGEGLVSVFVPCGGEAHWPPNRSQFILIVSIFDLFTLLGQKMLPAEVVYEKEVSDLEHLVLAILQIEMHWLLLAAQRWNGRAEENGGFLLLLLMRLPTSTTFTFTSLDLVGSGRTRGVSEVGGESERHRPLVLVKYLEFSLL